MTEVVKMPAAEIAGLPWRSVSSSNVSRIAHVASGVFICSGCGAQVGEGDSNMRAGDTTVCTVVAHPSERGVDVPVVEPNDLFVEFANGGLYRYAAVPEDDFKALVDADLREGASVGKTLHSKIKGRFPIVRVTAKDSNDEEGADRGDR